MTDALKTLRSLLEKAVANTSPRFDMVTEDECDFLQSIKETLPLLLAIAEAAELILEPVEFPSSHEGRWIADTRLELLHKALAALSTNQPPAQMRRKRI